MDQKCNEKLIGNSDVTFDLNARNGRIKWNADGSYPYKTKISVLDYEREKHELQIGLCVVSKIIYQQIPNK
jgi:hypothetical protein